ncbi:hypothetical protein HHK36_008030 [Tetracentron sinense]|uniref:Transcription termination factor MTERF4, chloroplastic n=1 Tax=Tetracentron sinense TaxID=13715 RepID=A0A834ZPD9_TETSI|nr:hypothetical protein HHK36_008030 [Tetracentron sinense]
MSLLFRRKSLYFFSNRCISTHRPASISPFLDFPQNPLNPCIQQPPITQISNPRVSIRFFSTQTGKFPEYEMPSVTWGVVQGRKEKLVSRVIVCDFLKGLGIIPDELEHLELPSTVEVMKERVEFLQKLGLTIDDINEYPLMLGCSVRKNMVPVLGYLEKIGIQRSKMGEFVKNYPQVLHASVVVELVPVVKFLRGLDVERQDIGYVLQKYPELLGFKLEGTMSTSVAYLVSIGVSPRDIGPMVTQYPYFLGMRVGTMIKPFVDYLVSLGLPKKILARMFEKRAYILGYDLEETVKLNVNCLISFGIRREVLASVIAQYPQILGLPLKAKLSSQQYFFNLKLKIDPEGFARIIEKMPQIVSLNQHVILKPIDFLVVRGIPSEDVAKMVVKCPQLFALRVELMKNSYYFFKSEMKRPLKELVEFPEYFTYSLESRIKPRYQRLTSKGVSWSLAWFLNCSDQRFEERLQADYIETESVGPSFCMGGKLELPGNEIVSEEEDESDDEKWVLKVSIHCEGSKRNVKKVVQSIDGVILYTTLIDSHKHKVTVTRNVHAETLGLSFSLQSYRKSLPSSLPSPFTQVIAIAVHYRCCLRPLRCHRKEVLICMAQLHAESRFSSRSRGQKRPVCLRGALFLGFPPPTGAKIVDATSGTSAGVHEGLTRKNPTISGGCHHSSSYGGAVAHQPEVMTPSLTRKNPIGSGGCHHSSSHIIWIVLIFSMVHKKLYDPDHVDSFPTPSSFGTEKPATYNFERAQAPDRLYIPPSSRSIGHDNYEGHDLYQYNDGDGSNDALKYQSGHSGEAEEINSFDAFME